jgi:threonine dehydrogenase-like Zn-dependent dehydrogenase
VTAVYYEGEGRFAVGESERLPPGPGEVRPDVAYCGVCGTDLHVAHVHMDGRVSAPQVIGHEMSGAVAEVGPDIAGLEHGDAVVVRPLDTRGETPADKGLQPYFAQPEVHGNRQPWRVPAVVDSAGVYGSQAAAGPRPAPGGAHRAAGGCLPRYAPR